ncbi:MAG: cadherin domain-containing protein [Bacteroidota bacterium]
MTDTRMLVGEVSGQYNKYNIVIYQMKNITRVIIILFLVPLFQYKGMAQNFNGGSGDGYSASSSASFNLVDIPEHLSITDVSSSNLNGIYKVSDVISVTVDFTQVVFVTGIPRILLETGTTDRYANYSSGDGSTTLVFSYTVQSGDINSDLDYTSVNALELNGGTIRNGSGTEAYITLPNPGAPNSLGDNKDIEIDGISPAVEITLATGQTDPTNNSPINFTATFSEDITGFVSNDISLSGTASATTVVLSGGPQIFNLAVSGMTNDGTVIVDIASGVCTDIVGNDNLGSINIANQVTYDGIKPTVIISSSESGTTELTNIPISITFSELVQGFGSDDINVTNGSISGFTQDVQDKQWSAFINPLAPGLINVSISADAATDFLNNGNLGSNVFSIEYIEVNHPPVAQNQVFSISEDSELGTIIGTVIALDQDNDNMSFSIVSGNVNDAFSIDPTNGELSLTSTGILNFDIIPEYQLTIQIEDDGNVPESTQCTVTINVIDVENPFEANNIFTPNDDRNKYWLIQNVQDYNDFELVIRTATGQIVYKTRNYQNDWNGTYNNQILPTGTYYFTLINSINGKSYSGFINLIRN